MKRSKRLALPAAALAVSAAAAAAAASETVTYTYDALGRLTGVSTSGGPNAGLNVSTGYDPAGNRASYGVTGATAGAAATSPTGEPAAALIDEPESLPDGASAPEEASAVAEPESGTPPEAEPPEVEPPPEVGR